MKTAYDYKHVKGTTAIALIKDGKQAGKIVANWSDNPNGTVCTATVHIECWGESYVGTGRASGYGYDKLSAAIYDALQNAYYHRWDSSRDLTEIHHDLSKVYKVEPGSGNQRHVFELLGYTYIEIC